ncbi:MAG: TylF/MycF/NovP-related O-methyltransferase, partial [Elusimicrobiota bacterium]
KGWFQETLPKAKSRIENIAILRVDCDWYESVRCCLDNLYDNLITGGYLIIDDYGHWEGCKKAVDEFLEKRKIKVRLNKIDYTGVWFQKF